MANAGNAKNKKDKTKRGNSKRHTKYIFVTGGVLSGVGKGISAASMGAILKAKGFKVSMQKCDPYLNVDAGLLNPVEHGECFVTHDGVETDLDLGHYERFLDFETNKYSITLSGAIYKELIEKERSGGFHGKTVQLVPHFTDLVQEKILRAGEGSDVHIVEIGGTVGDYEGLSFIEAIRLFANRVGRENCLYLSVVFVPWLNTSKELKTKPAQNALNDLRGFGIIPDVVCVRTERPASRAICEKIAAFAGISADAVVNLPDIASVYDVPFNVLKSGVLSILNKFVGDESEPDMSRWKKFSELRSKKYEKTVRVGLVAKYVGNEDTYICVTEALKAAAAHNKVNLEIVWINSEMLEIDSVTLCETFQSGEPLGVGSLHPQPGDSSASTVADTPQSRKRVTESVSGFPNFSDKQISLLAGVDGIVVPGGFGSRGVEGKILAATYALENDIPYLGLCLGMQVACIAAARIGGRQVSPVSCETFQSGEPLGVGSPHPQPGDSSASTVADTPQSRKETGETLSTPVLVSTYNSEEFGAREEDGNNVIYIMPGQKGKESTGASMRLGDYPAVLRAGTETARIYRDEVEKCGEYVYGTEVMKNGDVKVIERHRHRYEVNQKFLPEIEKGGVVVSGTSPDGKLVEFVEAPKCSFFQATQAHPELKSRPMNVHPLFMEFIKACKKQ